MRIKHYQSDRDVISLIMKIIHICAVRKTVLFVQILLFFNCDVYITFKDDLTSNKDGGLNDFVHESSANRLLFLCNIMLPLMCFHIG